MGDRGFEGWRLRWGEYDPIALTLRGPGFFLDAPT